MNNVYLQDVDALSCDVGIELILLVKVTSKHLRGLIYRMLNLHRNTTTSL